MKEKFKQKLIVILGIIVLILLILFDILFDFKSEDRKDENNKKESSLVTETKKTPTVTNYKEKYYKDQSELSEEEAEDTKDYVYEKLVGDFLETEVFASQGNNEALISMIDNKSSYGKNKIQELNELYDKGITKTLKSFYLDKFNESNNVINLYVVVYMGEIDSKGRVYEAQKSKKIYELKKLDNKSYMFIGEKDWK